MTKFIRANARTTSFLAHSAGRALRQTHEFPEIPTRRITPSLAMSVWVDELVMGMLPRMPAVPESEVPRLRADVARALETLERQGWQADPGGFYAIPAPPDFVEARPRRLGRAQYTRIAFDSDYTPHPDLPGVDRWLSLQGDGRAYAYVLRHPQRDRPWLVNLHGYSSGNPLDLVAFRSLRHHRELGYNVIHPVLPLHGPRALAGRRSGQGFLTMDCVQHLHAFGHAVWDVRRCIAWTREQGATSVTVHGVSLGGMITSLVAAVDDGIDRAIAGTPLVDLAKTVSHELTPEARASFEHQSLLDGRLEQLHHVVAPLEMDCRVPRRDRHVYAGVVDRMTTPGEAHRLWTHWGRPDVCWYAGSHCASSWSREVVRFVDGVLREPIGW